ncbi:DUF488 domain-containing protein [Pedobacter nutrimenti]|uniref:Uncharacterized protein DUF488 n=1 Tax=Pedobacter nutrimenti TaxID=1241337 RepID=A0A318U845_9SPHI|nr:DUF488 domain-containing protein [Pedobacter nutrimenti]PYF70625.1 uncharacterized protein DUF488 [Pedobacter nutrimenti]
MTITKLNTIWTIGHSTHTLEEFLTILKSFEIELVVDIRNFPGSKRYPHFNKAALSVSLPERGIGYIHLKDLGGRRKAKINSVNTAWRLPAFRGYADYMETPIFKHSINELEKLASNKRVAFMCAEAVWWSCHRSLVSDYLKHEGWKVLHIMAEGKATEHPYTAPARIKNGKLVYSKPNELFSPGQE